jgi:pyruvate dehydrogenase (quinone)
MAPRILEMAIRAAVEESGVAVVVIPGEIFLQRADASGWQSRPITPTRSVVRPDDESLRQAAEILNGAAPSRFSAARASKAPMTS